MGELELIWLADGGAMLASEPLGLVTPLALVQLDRPRGPARASRRPAPGCRHAGRSAPRVGKRVVAVKIGWDMPSTKQTANAQVTPTVFVHS